MNTSTILISIVILILLYPFILYYQLNTLKRKIDIKWSEIEVLLEEEKLKSSEEDIETIHRKRRIYNTLVRENNHRLSSSLAQVIAKKYNFTSRNFFKFQGR